MTSGLKGRILEIVHGRNHTTLSVARADRSVLTVVLWVHHEDGLLTVNSALGRAWPTLLLATRRATLTLQADGDPQEWVSIETRLADYTTEGAKAHLDSLSQKYFGTDYFAMAPGEQRVKFRLRPERVYYINNHER